MAASIAWLSCCEIIRATNLRITSPAQRYHEFRDRPCEAPSCGHAHHRDDRQERLTGPLLCKLEEETSAPSIFEQDKCSVGVPLAAPVFAISKLSRRTFHSAQNGPQERDLHGHWFPNLWWSCNVLTTSATFHSSLVPIPRSPALGVLTTIHPSHQHFSPLRTTFQISSIN